MKIILPCAVAALGLAAGLLHAADENAAPPAPAAKELRVLGSTGATESTPHRSVERRVIVKHAEGEKETVTFLGVDAAPIPPVLTSQLALQPGVGLVVNHIVPESSAAGVLQENDVLVKLDDQWLIETRQLSVLVRNHKNGDEVTLTYIRGGKQTTARVKLGQHEVPKAVSVVWPQAFPGMNGNALAFGKAQTLTGAGQREDLDRVLKLIRPSAGEPTRIEIDHLGGPGMRAMSINVANSTLVYNDDDGSLELTTKEGKKSLVAKNAKGEQVFSGPVTTPEERKAVPPAIRERLEKLEGMHDVTFRTDDAFQGAETRVLRPAPRGISFPQPTPHRPAPTFF